jgi:hypothetical protein
MCQTRVTIDALQALNSHSGPFTNFEAQKVPFPDPVDLIHPPTLKLFDAKFTN